jgi:phage gp16-like protein
MYEEWVSRMNLETRAAGKKAVVEEMKQRFGVSTPKAYNMLKEGGWDSGRKQRKDSGTTGLSEDRLRLIAGMLEISMRKNGNQSLPVNVARSIAEANGIAIPVGNSQLRSLLRRYNLAITDAKTPAPYQRMRSEYPNQVHCADPSVSLLWFSPGGKQKIVRDDEHYKNKDFYGDKKLKCWRYVLTDHFSATICVRYYVALGETAENMYDFLLYAWGKKRDSLYAFHGLPERLVWDKGSANIARSVTRALKALRVETDSHLPRNPRAKGQVEEANRLVETHFESRLRFEPVGSIDEINGAVERWCAAWNADMIAGEDCRLTRNGIKVGVRLMLWQKIKETSLRNTAQDLYGDFKMDHGQTKNTKNKRGKLIQLIHIGKVKIGLTDDTYRAFLEGITGRRSCTEMTERQLAAVLRAMRRNGFEQKPRRVTPEEQGMAAAAQLEYIKGMWQTCARNKSDKALLAFVNRIARVKALRFLTVHTARKVILALRDMMEKAGFDPDTSDRRSARSPDG